MKISIGPPIEQGFYYDFEFPADAAVSDADFERIEARMREHVEADEPLVRDDVPVAQARERFLAEGQDYKVELIDDLVRDQGVETVSLYTNGPFTDLCRGPHAPSTGRIKAFKLQSLAGAYWRGDANRAPADAHLRDRLPLAKDLDEHLERLEQARARDHRRIGRDLELFMFSPLSPGSPFWQPAGMAVWNALADLWREQNRARGYREVRTPILYDVDLWKQSGHWDKFRENMYFTDVEDRAMGLKPMNCPAHVQLYGRTCAPTGTCRSATPRPGLVHRHEPSGTLHGLLRVRHITQDDAHIFGTPEQIEDEVLGCWTSASSCTTCSASSRVWSCPRARRTASAPTRCGTGPRPRWPAPCAAAGLEYEIGEGEGTFYGPKIDLHMTDSIGRSWQLGTVQLDYQMPERFDLRYTGADNAEHRPVMIHRALFGSFERFIGILIEHYAGEFPLWLAPVQAIVLPIADRHLRLRARGARRAARGRPARGGRRTRGVGRAQDPRRRAAQGPVHARGGRPRARAAGGGRAPPRRGRRGRRAAGGVRRARDGRGRAAASPSVPPSP